MNITGTNGDDIGLKVLVGTNFADFIDGLAGNDVIFGQGGNDILVGGLGDDIIDGGSGFDTVSYAYGTEGYSVDLGGGSGGSGGWGRDSTWDDSDHLFSIENVWGSNFSDFIRGSDVANELAGRGGKDELYGEGGADSLSGGSGDDWLYGGAGADRLSGGSGVDTVNYYDYNYDYESTTGVLVSLSTGKGVGGEAQGDLLDGIENLYGSIHADLLIGNGANNQLRGESGEDILQAGAGADFLSGDLGKDTLTGGTGADVFYFTSHSSLSANPDVVTDFSSASGDKIDVTFADEDNFVYEDTCEFIGTAQFTDAHQVRYSTMADATIVEVSGDIEVSGDDAPVYTTIELDGIHALQASDFIL